MNISTAAEKTGQKTDTLRRWVGEHYADHFSPTARPPKGQPRVFTDEDLRLILYIAAQRDSGRLHREIQDRLRQGVDLPELQPDDGALTAPTDPAAQAAVLHVLKADLDRTRADLETAQAAVINLESKLEAAIEKHGEDAETVLQLRSDLAVAQAKLEVMGDVRDPLTVAGIVAIAAVVLVLLVIAFAVLLL